MYKCDCIVKSGPRGIYSRELYATTNVYYVSLHFWLPK